MSKGISLFISSEYMVIIFLRVLSCGVGSVICHVEELFLFVVFTTGAMING